jgi:hypothetical protein
MKKKTRQDAILTRLGGGGLSMAVVIRQETEAIACSNIIKATNKGAKTYQIIGVMSVTKEYEHLFGLNERCLIIKIMITTSVCCECCK